jgi:hypothetical protein
MKEKYMKLKIIMTIAGLSIASIGYSMHSNKTPVVAPKNPQPTASKGSSFEKTTNPVQKELSELQSKQRAQLSSPFRAVSDFSKNQLGISEQGILISKKPSLYDIELARIREEGVKNDGTFMGLLNNPTGIHNDTTFTGEKYLTSFDSKNKITIKVNPITNTIKWIDNKGNIVRMLKKNLNGTTTETRFNREYDRNKEQTIQTTYATENTDGQRTVITTITEYIIDPVMGFRQYNSPTTYLENYNEIGQKISDVNNSFRPQSYTSTNGYSSLTKSDTSMQKIYSDMVTGVTGGLINNAIQLTLPKVELNNNNN